MKSFCVNFSSERKGSDLRIFTSRFGPEIQDNVPAVDEPAPWGVAASAREAMERAVREALNGHGRYPEQEAGIMLHDLGWHEGFPLFAPQDPDEERHLKFTFGYKTCHLVPELAPIRVGNEVVWLDRLGPSYRTLKHVGQPPPRRDSRRNIAILFQDTEFWCPLAGDLQADLQRRLPEDSEVNTYRGTELSATAPGRLQKLHDIFHRHQAVVFVGIMKKAESDQVGGWRLSAQEDDVLTLAELRSFLGVPGDERRRWYRREDPRISCPIPEVVFACCCSSAGRDPGNADWAGLLYPAMFLEAGVRYFVGTWTDVIGDEDIIRPYLRDLIGGFLQGWIDDPDRCDEHLYRAKYGSEHEQALPLLSSLFHLYSVDGEQKAPRGALVSALAPGDRIGDYVLSNEVWTDGYARTFWAERESGTSHLVQVLADEWQDVSDLGEKLDAATEKLRGASLSPGHLIPDRHEYPMLHRAGRDHRELHVLVYDRPDGERAEDWSTLATHPAAEAQERFMPVLEMGARVAFLLAELHDKDIMHGNVYPGSILIRSGGGNVSETMLKDAWVYQTRPGRCVPPAYAAPEEPGGDEPGSRLKYDCWALGAILFERATGQPPFGEGELADEGLRRSIQEVVADDVTVPEALDRVVRECLVPSTRLRPAARHVAGRLAIAAHADGNYLGEFEERLNRYIQAGQRLFAVTVNDYDELLQALRRLCAQRHRHCLPGRPPRETVAYHLYRMEEYEGLSEERGTQHTRMEGWVDGNTVHGIMQAQNPGQPMRFPEPPEVAQINAGILFGHLGGLQATPTDVPIVLVRGNSWWDFGQAAHRQLKIVQAGGLRSPVIVVADTYISLESELSRKFVVLPFPSPTPTVLFERILALSAADGLDVPELSVEEAVSLAVRFFPASWREVRQSLRMCALQHGVFDERALTIRDRQREDLFRNLGAATYFPVSKLPDPRHFGMPSHLEKPVRDWTERTRHAGEPGAADGVLPRVMIVGEGGAGKTALALSLAARVGRQVVRVDASGCLQGALGESERTLRAVLHTAGALDEAVVLLDDVDRFFGGAPDGADAGAVAATMTRMSGVVLDWMDERPAGISVIMTARSPERLPAQWRRRCEVTLHLSPSVQEDKAYRRAVFAAVFRKFGLSDIADDADLIDEITAATDPHTGIAGLLSPVARKARGTALADHTVRLETGADIHTWVEETLQLHGKDALPKTPAFWQDALTGVTEQTRRP